MDKTAWLQVVANDCAIPEGHTVAELTPELLQFLASTDQQLRDDVAYMVFARWIVRDKHYSPDDLRGLIKTLTGNFQIGLGEQDTNSVLLRSFSALALSLIVYRDNQDSFLESAEIKDMLDKTLAYLSAEADLRGYIEGTGWHHATAHIADVLKFLARNVKTDVDDHTRILNAIADKLIAPVTHVYIHDEDERLVLAVVDILRRKLLDKTAFLAWLDRFKTWKQSWPADGDFKVTTHAPYMNCKNFIRSLYLTCVALSAQSDLAKDLKDDIENLVAVFGMGTVYVSK